MTEKGKWVTNALLPPLLFSSTLSSNGKLENHLFLQHSGSQKYALFGGLSSHHLNGALGGILFPLSILFLSNKSLFLGELNSPKSQFQWLQEGPRKMRFFGVPENLMFLLFESCPRLPQNHKTLEMSFSRIFRGPKHRKASPHQFQSNIPRC